MDQQLLEPLIKKSNEVLHLILQEYKTLVDNISASHFNVFTDVVEKETGKGVDRDAAVVAFKNKLMKQIEIHFRKNWSEMDIDSSLALLEASKIKAQDQEKKWRPTNVPVVDQVVPKTMKERLREKNWLEGQIKRQDQVIEEQVLKIEQLRGQCKISAAKREYILSQFKAEKDNFKNVEKHIKQINEELSSLSVKYLE